MEMSVLKLITTFPFLKMRALLLTNEVPQTVLDVVSSDTNNLS